MRHTHRYRGVTLIEAVLFISIAMGIIVGGLQFYRQATIASRTLDTVRLTASLVSETQNIFRMNGFPGGAGRTRIDPVLAAAGSIVASARSDDPAFPIRSAWGSPITVDGGTGEINGSEGPVALHVVYEDIPLPICTRIVSVDSGGSGPLGSGIIEVGVHDSGGNLVSHHIPATDGELSPSLGAAMCRLGGTENRLIVSYAWQ